MNVRICRREVALRCARILAGAAFLAAPAVHAQFDALDPALLTNILSQARAYEQGQGVVKDPARAVRLYCKAARFGDMEAQYRLASMYAEGRGAAKDAAVAALFLMLAALQGHTEAQQGLMSAGEPTVAVPECLRDPLTVEEAFPENEPTVAALAGAEPEAFVAITAAQRKALEIVNNLAPEYGVTPRLAIAVIRAESNFDPAARSPKNAQGLMQLIPETSARFNVTKPFDATQNVRGGLAYLRWLLAYFQGDVALVAAAYNAGERAVDRYRGIPPYPETRGYVKRVVEFFGRHEHPFDAAVTAPSEDLRHARRLRAALPGRGDAAVLAAP